MYNPAVQKMILDRMAEDERLRKERLGIAVNIKESASPNVKELEELANRYRDRLNLSWKDFYRRLLEEHVRRPSLMFLFKLNPAIQVVADKLQEQEIEEIESNHIALLNGYRL